MGGEDKPPGGMMSSWRLARGRLDQRFGARWRYAAGLFGALSLLFVLNQAVKYKYIWHEKGIRGENMEATPWQPHVDLVEHATLWQKLTAVHTIARCHGRCSAPPKANASAAAALEPAVCPVWFEYIRRDLEPWKGGISRAHLAAAEGRAAFRAVVVAGRLYVEQLYKCPVSRQLYTFWGLALLLRRFPGAVPDLELLFDCTDAPLAKLTDEMRGGDAGAPPGAAAAASPLPALFGYSSMPGYLDVPFPDWSFWGGPEGAVQPWETARQVIHNSTRKSPLAKRQKHSLWKGHLGDGSPHRPAILECQKLPENAVEAEAQDEDVGRDQEHSTSHLAEHCTHRFKVYAEGATWSIGLKYALACGSVLLLLPHAHHDFYSRGLEPLRHVWPVTPGMLCNSLRFAVEYGNDHPPQSEHIGQHGKAFCFEDLSMANVYSYMLHLLTEYAALLNFTPQVPAAAREVCPEVILCLAEPWQRPILSASLPHADAGRPIPPPCALPPPPEGARELAKFEARALGARAAVEECESHGPRWARFCKLGLWV